MNVDITLYEYSIMTGQYDIVKSDVRMDGDIKELFEFVTTDVDKMNKFFIVRTEYIGLCQAIFYSIRTDKDGNIVELEKIVPNNIDKDMLIDAIVGCNPSKEFMELCKDRIIERCIEFGTIPGEKTFYIWTHDVKDRLKKMNALRLKEIYKKLKSLPQ